MAVLADMCRDGAERLQSSCFSMHHATIPSMLTLIGFCTGKSGCPWWTSSSSGTAWPSGGRYATRIFWEWIASSTASPFHYRSHD